MSRPHAWPEQLSARFFDLIADGVSIGMASRRVGKSRGAGQGHFARKRQAMGWQAR